MLAFSPALSRPTPGVVFAQNQSFGYAPPQTVMTQQIQLQQTCAPVASSIQTAPRQKKANDCGCDWFACPLCNGGQIPKFDVSCIPLGAWCGVSQCLRGNKLRTEAFPFDWNRVSLEGVIHFIETRFEDFLQHQKTKDFPWDKQHGGLAYCGKYHSFWHDDLSKQEVHDKYKRRIDRLFNNPVEKLLFIRAVNESAEVPKVDRLLEVLQRVFSNHEVWLSIIVDHQPFAESYVVQGTDNRLLIHTTEKRHLRTALYYDDVKAYDQAILTAFSCALGRAVAPNIRTPGHIPVITSLQGFAAQLEPFFSGSPQEETWDPKPAPANFKGFESCPRPINMGQPSCPVTSRSLPPTKFSSGRPPPSPLKATSRNLTSTSLSPERSTRSPLNPAEAQQVPPCKPRPTSLRPVGAQQVQSRKSTPTQSHRAEAPQSDLSLFSPAPSRTGWQSDLSLFSLPPSRNAPVPFHPYDLRKARSVPELREKPAEAKEKSSEKPQVEEKPKDEVKAKEKPKEQKEHSAPCRPTSKSPSPSQCQSSTGDRTYQAPVDIHTSPSSFHRPTSKSPRPSPQLSNFLSKSQKVWQENLVSSTKALEGSTKTLESFSKGLKEEKERAQKVRQENLVSSTKALEGSTKTLEGSSKDLKEEKERAQKVWQENLVSSTKALEGSAKALEGLSKGLKEKSQRFLERPREVPQSPWKISRPDLKPASQKPQLDEKSKDKPKRVIPQMPQRSEISQSAQISQISKIPQIVHISQISQRKPINALPGKSHLEEKPKNEPKDEWKSKESQRKGLLEEAKVLLAEAKMCLEQQELLPEKQLALINEKTDNACLQVQKGCSHTLPSSEQDVPRVYQEYTSEELSSISCSETQSDGVRHPVPLLTELVVQPQVQTQGPQLPSFASNLRAARQDNEREDKHLTSFVDEQLIAARSASDVHQAWRLRQECVLKEIDETLAKRAATIYRGNAALRLRGLPDTHEPAQLPEAEGIEAQGPGVLCVSDTELLNHIIAHQTKLNSLHVDLQNTAAVLSEHLHSSSQLSHTTVLKKYFEDKLQSNPIQKSTGAFAWKDSEFTWQKYSAAKQTLVSHCKSALQAAAVLESAPAEAQGTS